MIARAARLPAACDYARTDSRKGRRGPDGRAGTGGGGGASLGGTGSPNPGGSNDSGASWPNAGIASAAVARPASSQFRVRRLRAILLGEPFWRDDLFDAALGLFSAPAPQRVEPRSDDGDENYPDDERAAAA